MGNVVAGKFPGTVRLQVDPPPAEGYIAGQKIRGAVYCTSTKSLDAGVPLNVDAFLVGKERSLVKYEEIEYYYESFINAEGRRVREQRARTVTRYRYAERNVVAMAIHLADISTGVKQGVQYKFPFQVTLPQDLPSSMHCQEHSHVYRNYGHYDY
eukprot:15042484-Ditylum_brightwellii.AAC.1